ncbi:uncharacterized protein LOC129293557 isoform X2 [Prosopis cineraria]|uniref:uncharacterized protein LOC129293557 isoform X2 n=1 Tax=Prosopis cineraria TaxID=364024 RepID=UPI00240FBEBF|nr:uncharacterized protein LOC129293557 isoform X2 [Prosopis cineraria]
MALYSLHYPASRPCRGPAPAPPPPRRLRPFSLQKLFTSARAATSVSQHPLLNSSFIDNVHPFTFSPSLVPTRARSLNAVKSVFRTNFDAPLISPEDQWGTWTGLFAAVAFGIWLERTKIGSTLSGSLVSILVGLAASNLGIIASEASAYKIVIGFLLPIAVTLLLFRADLRRVIKSPGTLLLAFLLGSGKLAHFDSDALTWVCQLA